MKRARRILLSMLVVTVAAAAVVVGTRAFFWDSETSSGNIMRAGSIDLMIDHTRQTYNGVDCMTCDLTLVSGTSNRVIDKTDYKGTYVYPVPFSAALVSSPHPDWTDEIPEGAEWIWATDPTTQYDAENEVIYTFEKTFTWWGPIEKATGQFAVASDNSVRVYLNDTFIGGYEDERGFDDITMIVFDDFAAEVKQGENVLHFKVTNWEPDGFEGTPSTNPGGLVYKLAVTGECEDGYFEDFHATCELWGFKDLEDEKFFNFNDIKPGDWGTNLISYHVYDNDAYVCMHAANLQDYYEGEHPLSEAIQLRIWNEGGDLYTGPLGHVDGFVAALAEGVGNEALASHDYYVNLEWCAGNWVDGDCYGGNMGNEYQNTSLEADLMFYAIQARHNEDFSCDDVWPEEEGNNAQ